MNSDSPLVSVVCVTYNHGPYIAEAIESFLQQETDFPFEIIIGEDFSTDETREICLEYAKKYPDKIHLAISDGNVGARNNYFRALSAARGKYIAFCEGDDYWSDPKKLAIQIGYMEKHPECSLTFHSVRIINGDKATNKTIRPFNKKTIIPKNTFFGYGTMAPSPTLVYPRKYIIDPPDWLRHSPVGDIPLKLYLSQLGTVVYLDKIMAMRRIGVEGSWSKRMQTFSYRQKLFPGMIVMLEGFNEFSKYIYAYQVLKKQLSYEIKSVKNPITKVRQMLKLIRTKYSKSYSSLSLTKKMFAIGNLFITSIVEQVARR
ncbi:MAG: glycosyltransferase [Candidatus Nomurabacteria bacterium]|nr:MAG: glycosyltransferase [Candidatus Nomurabacteria bacterium]